MTQYREARHLPHSTFSRYGTSVDFRDEAYAFESSHHMLYVLVAVRNHRIEHENWKYTSKKVIGASNDKDALVLGANDTVHRGAPFASTHVFSLRYVCRLSGRSLCVWKLPLHAIRIGSCTAPPYRARKLEPTSKQVTGVSNDKDALVLGANDTVQRGAPFASIHFFLLRYLCRSSGRS